jgi:hypothetical protein
LGKAREFLTAIGFSFDLELVTAATSSAVISGINAKDAICLRLTGKMGETENHLSAVEGLNACGAGSKGMLAKTKGLAVVFGAGWRSATGEGGPPRREVLPRSGTPCTGHDRGLRAARRCPL